MNITSFPHMESICDNYGRIILPEWCRRVKIDVGLSCNAPQSRVWIENDPTLYVFGLEPNHSNLLSIITGASGMPNRIDWDVAARQMSIIPYAVSNHNDGSRVKFFATHGDGGQSSILRPFNFQVRNTYSVTTIRLGTLIKAIVEGSGLIVEHVKTDCQGYDFEVLKSAGDWLKYVCAYTFEYEPWQYECATTEFSLYHDLLSQAGFAPVQPELLDKLGISHANIQTEDVTYINLRHSSMLRQADSFIYQKG
jgi:FkbM family methyltransferase